MECPNCNSLNPEGSRFCQECGNKLDPYIEVEDEISTEKDSYSIKLTLYKCAKSYWPILLAL